MCWTIVASGIGSATALAIAFFAYPWQKGRDRALQIALEQRKAYAEILRLIYRFRRRIDELAFDSPEILSDGLKELDAASNTLDEEIFVVAVISEKTIFLEISRCNEALRKVYLEISREMESMVSSGRDSFASTEVKTAFREAQKRAYADIDKATNQLVSVVRKNAFNLDGMIEITSRRLASQAHEVADS